MSWYAVTLFIAVIVYAEVVRRRANQKVNIEIKKTQKDVKYQLEMLNKMFIDADCPACNRNEKVVSGGGRAVLLERKE